MSSRIRGEEISVRFMRNGAPLGGSFLKVQDFEVTPRTDLKETDFLGETETDTDIQHHGFDVSWSMHNLDAQTMDFLDDLIQNEEEHNFPDDVRVQVLYSYRGGTDRNRVVTYYRGVVKVSSEGFRSRKEYVETKCEGKFAKRKTLTL
jgi:hypothetical protein